MSETFVIHDNFHTKHSVLTAPDEHLPYIIQLHIMSRWGSRTYERDRESERAFRQNSPYSGASALQSKCQTETNLTEQVSFRFDFDRSNYRHYLYTYRHDVYAVKLTAGCIFYSAYYSEDLTRNKSGLPGLTRSCVVLLSSGDRNCVSAILWRGIICPAGMKSRWDAGFDVQRTSLFRARVAAFRPLPLLRRACYQSWSRAPVASLLTQNTKGMPFSPGFSWYAFYVLTLASASTDA